MSTDRDTTRIVTSWLEEGADRVPDRVLDAVEARLHATPQRRAGWLARRFLIMNNNTVRYGIVAAAVVLVAFLGFNLMPRTGTGGPPASPTAASPTAAATPRALPDGPLAKGTYVLHPFASPHDRISVAVTVPNGWEGFDGHGLLPTTGAAGPDGMGMGFAMVSELYSDPCHALAPDWPVGRSVDDLVRAFRAQTAYDTTDPVALEIDGYSGTQLSLLMPTDVDFGACDNGGFYVWDGSIYAQGPGNRWDLIILDIEGTRVVVLAQTNPETSAQDRAELQDILDSIQIDAAAPSAQQSTSG